jgi:HAE1 family hydrophobic/amphiphilic exporter-1
VPGTRDITNSGAQGQPEVVVRLDRARAADLGISAAQAASAVRTAIAGTVVTQYRPPQGKSVDVRVMFDDSDLTRIDQIRTIPLTTNKGTIVQLGQIATIERANSAPQIDRRDRQRLVTVSANAEGRSPGEVTRDAEALVSKLSVPAGYAIKLAGSAQEQSQSFGQLFMALALSILLTYMVTVALYESLLLPFVVLTALPLASAGAIGALALTGQRLSLISLIGFIMLAGLVGKAAILLVDYTQQLRRRGLSRTEALLEAAPIRLRPIVMTTTALVIALMPVALGLGDGAELRQPIAIPVIGGILTSTLLTLVFIPSVYTIVDDMQAFVLRLFRRGPRAAAPVDGLVDGVAAHDLGRVVARVEEPRARTGR